MGGGVGIEKETWVEELELRRRRGWRSWNWEGDVGGGVGIENETWVEELELRRRRGWRSWN